MKDRRFERAAQDYAVNEYFVFQCRPRTKEPFGGTNGFHNSTRDERQILQLWDRNPYANIAIDLGRSRVNVLDFDSKHGADPRELIAALGLEDYPVVWTGEAPEPDADHPNSLPGVRGAHVLFKGTRRTTDLKLRGVELRGAGGYVLAPPSVHPSGVPYEGAWPAYAALPDEPAGIEILCPAPAPSSVAVPGDNEIVEQGGRHEKLLAWGRSSYTAKGVLGVPALDGMRGHNARCNRPPLEDAEVVRLWRHLEKTKIATNERKVARIIAGWQAQR
jgi:hypothetical protein